MSQISKALKKIQESRQSQQALEPKVGEIVYLTDPPKIWPQIFLMSFLAAGMVAAIVISMAAVRSANSSSESKQMEVSRLEKIIGLQQSKINDLVTLFNKQEKVSNSQIRDLRFRLKTERKNMQAQIDALTVNDKDAYANVKEAILAANHQLNDLEQNINGLKRVVEKISAQDSQAKNLLVSTTGS